MNYKPGWKTTEFWLTAALLAMVFVVVIRSVEPIDQKVSLVIAQLSVGVYTHGRSRVKSSGPFEMLGAIARFFVSKS